MELCKTSAGFLAAWWIACTDVVAFHHESVPTGKIEKGQHVTVLVHLRVTAPIRALERPGPLR
jgi:hypothetical protein